jgi:AhpD family alkylhydroperoxidase
MHRMKVVRSFLAGVLLLVVAAGSSLPAHAQAADASLSPTRQKVYAEMKEMFGIVPGFMTTMSDVSLEDEWRTMQSVQMKPGPIPNKYRELIGLAVAAARGCDYCAYFHTEFAKLNGASAAEIEDAVHYAKSNAGWSTYLHGMQYPRDKFQKEVDQIVTNAKAKMAQK